MHHMVGLCHQSLKQEKEKEQNSQTTDYRPYLQVYVTLIDISRLSVSKITMKTECVETDLLPVEYFEIAGKK